MGDKKKISKGGFVKRLFSSGKKGSGGSKSPKVVIENVNSCSDPPKQAPKAEAGPSKEAKAKEEPKAEAKHSSSENIVEINNNVNSKHVPVAEHSSRGIGEMDPRHPYGYDQGFNTSYNPSYPNPIGYGYDQSRNSSNYPIPSYPNPNQGYDQRQNPSYYATPMDPEGYFDPNRYQNNLDNANLARDFDTATRYFSDENPQGCSIM